MLPFSIIFSVFLISPPALLRWYHEAMCLHVNKLHVRAFTPFRLIADAFCLTNNALVYLLQGFIQRSRILFNVHKNDIDDRFMLIEKNMQHKSPSQK